jgi:hypothetical protein
MKTIKKILVQELYDRYVFLTYENGKIIGLNFHHGIDHPDFESFLEPCEKLTTIFNKICIKNAHLNLSEKKLINKSMNKYYDKYLYPKETITIPTGQTKLIQEAIKFYLKGFAEFNAEPTQEEHYKIFDLQQLDAMLNYKISITIETQNKDSFAHKHGMDFPEYL